MKEENKEKFLSYISEEDKRISKEVENFAWFEHRLLPCPVLRTLSFIKQYRRAREFYLQRYWGKSIPPNFSFSAPDSLLEFWRARCLADKYGCEYEWFCIFAAERLFQRSESEFPHPSRLHQEDFEEDLKIKLQEMKTIGSFQVASHHLLLAEELSKPRLNPVQKVYLAYLLGHTFKTKNPRTSAGRLKRLVNLGAVTLDMPIVQKLMTKEVFDAM